MIQTQSPAIPTQDAGFDGIVPRARPDDRGLGEALARAADDGPAEAEMQRQAHLRRADQELAIVKTTRALFIDALYRAKALNGDAAFDVDDVEDLDALEGMAARLMVRRKLRSGECQ